MKITIITITTIINITTTTIIILIITTTTIIIVSTLRIVIKTITIIRITRITRITKITKIIRVIRIKKIKITTTIIITILMGSATATVMIEEMAVILRAVPVKSILLPQLRR